MKESRAAKHQICLVTPSRGEFTELCESESVPIVQLPMARTFHFHRAWQFARFLRAWRADVVHCHAAVTGSILARLGARLAGVPIISHVHIENKFSDVPFVRSLQIYLDNLTARFTDEIVTISEDTRLSLIEQGISSKKVKVIYNGVSAREDVNREESQRARHTLGIESSVPVIGMVARLCPVKGQWEFILAARQVKNNFPDAEFAIIGQDLECDGNYHSKLERLAKRLGLEPCIKFLGFRRDAAHLMYAFDAFVLPSWIEGMPVTILEAMAAGKPVVATPVGGVPELVVDGETGILVPPRDPDQLAKAIIDLLHNPEVAGRMGQSGTARLRREFSQEKMFDQVNALYQALSPSASSS